MQAEETLQGCILWNLRSWSTGLHRVENAQISQSIIEKELTLIGDVSYFTSKHTLKC